MKILIVDDDALTTLTIANKLRSKGHDLYTAAGGVEALEIIKTHRPDLIICDILMPDISGLSLLSLLKNFYFEKIPIILMSSLKQAKVITESLAMGAYDYIIKPIDLNKLLLKIESFSAGRTR